MIHSLFDNKSNLCDIDNEPFTYSAKFLTNVVAEKIFKEVVKYPIYKEIINNLPRDKVKIYFLLIISDEIYPYIRQLLLIKRKLQAGKMYLPPLGIFGILKNIFHENSIPTYFNPEYWFKSTFAKVKYDLKESLKELVFAERWWSPFALDELVKDDPKIAVHLVEGLDATRRSDFTWFTNSDINPKNILVYIDSINFYYSYQKSSVSKRFKYVPEKVLQYLNQLGIKWIIIDRALPTNKLNKTAMTVKTFPVRWQPEWLKVIRKNKLSEIEKWILKKTSVMTHQINFWMEFYKTFNVKLLFLAEEGRPLSIAQGIAFDLLGGEGGFSIGKQRSDTGDAKNGLTGFHTKDIYFGWNERGNQFLQPCSNKVMVKVVTGHSNDKNFYTKNEDAEAIRKRLHDNGVRFIIALFDTGHDFLGTYTFSTLMMQSFYNSFLTLVLEDCEIGLVIKSKKPYVISTLPGKQKIFLSAEATGRCVKLNNEVGRLPSDASRIADIAIGAGVSSALTEAVIAGTRGCHYHYAFPKRHDYYKWGYDKFVFDNLDRLIQAIKIFKASPKSKPELGDWTAFLDKLDPYRDGHAGDRMGEYLKWVLQGFEAGSKRDDILSHATMQYTAKWGSNSTKSFN